MMRCYICNELKEIDNVCKDCSGMMAKATYDQLKSIQKKYKKAIYYLKLIDDDDVRISASAIIEVKQFLKELKEV
ncbi:MAG: DUF4301 family protein [bacterium]|nr:DUF4301 family protein [bacterium]